MWYNIDYDKLVIDMLPTFLRKARLIAFVQSCVLPIKQKHYQWLNKRNQDWYKINHNGQICFLRKALNDALDISLRRIYIGDGNAFPRKYIYTHQEAQPRYIGTYYIYQRSEFIGTGADFIVYVPQEIIDNNWHELNAIIKFYKLASKRYQILAI